MKRYQSAIRNILTLTVLPGLLLSCGVYTQYKRPEHALYGLDSLYHTENRPDTDFPSTSSPVGPTSARTKPG